MSPKIDDRARQAAAALHAAAATRAATVDRRRGRGRELLLAAATVVLVVGIAVALTRGDDRVSVTTHTRPSPVVVPHTPNCTSDGTRGPWPRTGFANATSWKRAADLVTAFGRVEMGLSHSQLLTVAAMGACGFEVRGPAGRIDVLIGGNAANGYFVSSFRSEYSLDDVPLSIQISGLHVEVHTVGCPGCSQVLKVTYADAAVRLTSTTGGFKGSLPKASSGPGTIVVLTRNARGQLVRALGIPIPGGDFAAG